MLDLALTPSGHLALVEGTGADGVEPESAVLPETVGDSLRNALRKGCSELLLRLAILPGKANLPPVFLFWRGLGERYLMELCHVPEPSGDIAEPLSAPSEELAEMAAAAPPMRGGEYLRAETLAAIWEELDGVVRREIAAQPGGLGEWLHQRSPQWHRVGRVCFHLAENKRDPECPFAFLATYAPKLLEGGRVQYQPLGRALEEYAGARNRKMLVNLLTPVQRAAERCAWVKELVDTGNVFRPLAWTPNEAHRLLRDTPALEESGVLVRVPNWWARRGPRVRVGVTVGRTRPSQFGADAMLDFKVQLSLDGETLTPEEWRSILEGSDGLAFLKGRWVEVDREKLQEALKHWKRVEKQVGGDGVSFLQGMRLLAGAPIDTGETDLFDEHTAAWSEVRAGAWLEESLRQIRQPDCIEAAVPPSELRATLRPYQKEGVKWLWLLTRLGLGACLADDMGLGKTIQVLSLLLMMKDQRSHAVAATDLRECRGPTPSPRPALLVVPASLLANWKAEIERFAPSLRCLFAHPSQTKADDLKAASENPERILAATDAVLTTYSMLTRLEWLGTFDWSLAVLDEAQAIKNPTARQTRAVKQLKAGARIVLTGTPVENRLTDLWSIFDFLCPGLLGAVKTFGGFVNRLEQRPKDQYGPLRRLVGPYILRRMKTDKSIIADLPDKVELQAFCHLSKKQAVLYEDSVRALGEALREQQDGIARRGLILTFIMRFKQICNHPDQWLGSGGYSSDDSGKFHRLRELCDQIADRQEKVLVFSQFREITAPLASFMETVFGRAGLMLHGGTAVGKRKQIVDEFQRESGPPFMVLSLKAGGTGLNLTAATHVIHFDRWWNPAVENQATDRAFRIGQTRNVMVHKFVCQGTIEEKIDALIRDKTTLAGEILDEGVPKLVTEMSDGELLDLVRLDITRATED
ncbi:MAG: DEAD/DEAH box helicase [Planctomycetes bacterium]|nr:DEAD/DEAH box helicase [Planctomycetota bacterium]